MVELVDTRDLKSLDQKRSCGFESRSRHIACKARNAISGYIPRHIACKIRNETNGVNTRSRQKINSNNNYS